MSIAIGGLSLAFWLPRGKAEVAIVNAATERIKAGNLIIGGHRLEFESLKTGEKVVFRVEANTDSSYEITVIFESGRELSGRVGYLSPGLVLDDLITIKDDDISYSTKSRMMN
jgi:hypothetical protein